MSLLIVLFYLIVWSCGLVNLFILALLFGRDREVLYRHEFLLMLSFTLLLVLESLPLQHWGQPLASFRFYDCRGWSGATPQPRLTLAPNS